MANPYNKQKIYRKVASADTNAAVIKTGPADLNGYSLTNASASNGVFVKIYDMATTPDENDTPILTIGAPAGESLNFIFPGRIATAVGLSIRMTGAAGDTDTTALTAGDIIAQLFYN